MTESYVIEKILSIFIQPVIFLLIFVLYIGLLNITDLFTKKSILHRKKFTKKVYYIIMLWVPISYIILSFIFDTRYIVFFIITGFAGIIGETILSTFWDIALEKPVWTYHNESAIGGYTSTLNFFPWSMGAFIFLSIAKVVNVNENAVSLINISLPWYIVFLASFAFGIVLTIIIELILEYCNKKDKKFLDLKFTGMRLLIFCIPIIFTYINLILFASIKYAILCLLFASIGNITEYLYGKYISRVFNQRLWTYNYLKLDHGHSSLTNLPLWAFGGLYFYLIAFMIGIAK